MVYYIFKCIFPLSFQNTVAINGTKSLVTMPLVGVGNPSTILVQNHWYTQEFWTYLSVRVLLDVLRASSLMLFEGAVVSIIKKHGGDYGLQKLFGTFGAVIFGPLSGILIDFGQVFGCFWSGFARHSWISLQNTDLHRLF